MSSLLFLIALTILFIFFCKIIISSTRYLSRRFAIPRRVKNSFRVFTTLYKDVNGIAISLAERERLQLQDLSFTYGEINPGTFAAILEIAKPQAGDVFFDLGCGTGKAVFCAAMLYDWSR